eukprot:6367503-Amphidinium_carterae.1
MWNGAVRGVTELTERMRCTDVWWNEVTDQLRAGHLSKENWRYLHGLTVPGCTLTVEERESRHRVVNGANDERLQEERFHS